MEQPASPSRQHGQIVKNERLWRTLALRDAVYNRKQASRNEKKGNHILARNYRMESEWDMFWARKRQGIVNANLPGRRR